MIELTTHEIVVDIESTEFDFKTLEQEVEKHFMEMIKHHLDRAHEHAKNGKFEYASGSRLKALKWIKRLEEATKIKTGLKYIVCETITKSYVDDIADAIIHGKRK